MKQKNSRDLVNTIQEKTGKSIKEIAQVIGMSRAYFNHTINQGGNRAINSLLEEHFADVLTPEVRETEQTKSVTQVSKDPYLSLMEERVTDLKEDKRRLYNILETSLAGIAIGQKSILAHVATILDKDNERDSAGNKKKLELLTDDSNRRIAEKFQVVQQTGIDGR